MSRTDVREDTITVDEGPAGDEATEAVEDTGTPAAGGDPRALLATRVLGFTAMLVTSLIHARLAFTQDSGTGGLLSQSHLFAAQAALSLVIGIGLLTKDNRAWLVAVVLSVAGLGAILSSVYLPLPAVGPLPAIDEPTWLLTKAVCAMTELSVVVLWLIRQIAPPTER